MRWVLVLLFFAAFSAPAQERLLVFAAASLKNALDEVNAAYGSPVVASYAASSALARQIEAGAPAQVFISADLEWMDYLERKSLLHPGTRRDLLSNRLVWIVPAGRQMPAQPLAALGTNGRLALADPQHVPAGKYAKAALEKMGLWQAAAARIAAAENVRAALAFVARGEAPLGIVYQTDARAEPKVAIGARIDPRLHPPIVYPAASLRGAGERAGRYLAFLAAPQASAIFEKHGFDVGR
ncbi:MAG: molybdate ABC transporter substrate-binding protein [Betaproteobacteria bacterium]